MFYFILAKRVKADLNPLPLSLTKPKNGIDSVYFSINDLNTKCHTSFLSGALIRAFGKTCMTGLGPIWGNTIKIGWYAEPGARWACGGGRTVVVFSARSRWVRVSGWVGEYSDCFGCRLREKYIDPERVRETEKTKKRTIQSSRYTKRIFWETSEDYWTTFLALVLDITVSLSRLKSSAGHKGR